MLEPGRMALMRSRPGQLVPTFGSLKLEMGECFSTSSNVSFTQLTIMSSLTFCPLPISSRIFSVYLLSCSACLVLRTFGPTLLSQEPGVQAELNFGPVLLGLGGGYIAGRPIQAPLRAQRRHLRQEKGQVLSFREMRYERALHRLSTTCWLMSLQTGFLSLTGAARAARGHSPCAP